MVVETLYPGMIASKASLANATAPVVGKTFALTQTPQSDPQGQEITAEYEQDVDPDSVAIDIEGGNAVDASGDLTGSIEVLATINTLGAKSIRVDTGRYTHVRANLTTLTGVSAEVTLKLKR